MENGELNLRPLLSANFTED